MFDASPRPELLALLAAGRLRERFGDRVTLD